MLRFVPILSLLVSSSMSTAAPPLQPSDKWQLDYGDTQCTAARAFGTGSDRVVLGIVPVLSGATFQFLVSAQGAAGPAKESEGTVSFGRGQITTRVLSYGDKEANARKYQYRVSAEQMEQARAADALSLNSGEGHHFAFALSDMPALLDRLHDCTGNLQRYWNMGETRLSVAEVPERDTRAYLLETITQPPQREPGSKALRNSNCS